MSYSISIPNVEKKHFRAEVEKKLAETFKAGDPQEQKHAASKALHKATDIVDDLWPAATHIGCSVSGHDQPSHDGASGTTMSIALQSLSPPPQ